MLGLQGMLVVVVSFVALFVVRSPYLGIPLGTNTTPSSHVVTESLADVVYHDAVIPELSPTQHSQLFRTIPSIPTFPAGEYCPLDPSHPTDALSSCTDYMLVDPMTTDESGCILFDQLTANESSAAYYNYVIALAGYITYQIASGAWISQLVNNSPDPWILIAICSISMNLILCRKWMRLLHTKSPSALDGVTQEHVKENKCLEQIVDKLNQDVKRLKISNNRYIAENDRFRKDLHDEREWKRSEINQKTVLKEKAKSLESEIIRLESEVIDLKADKTNLGDEMKTLRSGLTQYEEIQKDFYQTLKELETALKEEVEGERERTKLERHAREAAERSHAEESDKFTARWAQWVNDAEEGLKKKLFEVVEHATQVQDEQAAKSAADLRVLREKLEDCEEHRSKLDATVQKDKDELAARYDDQLKSLQKKVRYCEDHHDTFDSKLQAAKDPLGARTSQLDVQTEKQRKELKSKEGEIDALNEGFGDLKKENEELGRQLEACNWKILVPDQGLNAKNKYAGASEEIDLATAQIDLIGESNRLIAANFQALMYKKEADVTEKEVEVLSAKDQELKQEAQNLRGAANDGSRKLWIAHGQSRDLPFLADYDQSSVDIQLATMNHTSDVPQPAEMQPAESNLDDSEDSLFGDAQPDHSREQSTGPMTVSISATESASEHASTAIPFTPMSPAPVVESKLMLQAQDLYKSPPVVKPSRKGEGCALSAPPEVETRSVVESEELTELDDTVTSVVQKNETVVTLNKASIKKVLTINTSSSTIGADTATPTPRRTPNAVVSFPTETSHELPGSDRVVSSSDVSVGSAVSKGKSTKARDEPLALSRLVQAINLPETPTPLSRKPSQMIKDSFIPTSIRTRGRGRGRGRRGGRGPRGGPSSVRKQSNNNKIQN